MRDRAWTNAGRFTLTKRISITVVEPGVTAIAELQENDAPKTTAALWNALESPLVSKGIHAMWAGREVMVEVPPANQTFDPTAIPTENATVYPAAGDICWGYFPPFAERGFGHGVWDIAVIYGRETRFYVPLGMLALNIWACITDNLDEFATACATLRIEGLKTFRFSRLDG
jgi:hypothetical protein